MARFTSTNQPQNRGRPVGSKAKKVRIPDELTSIAIDKLEEACISGEQWAVVEILKRVAPTLKAITQEGSLDAKLIDIKIKEATDWLARLEALEQRMLS